LVGGFAVPENLRYHPGHTWALSESPNLVRVGMDDFASKLTGRSENITLPQRGQWIRQGQKVCTIYRDDVPSIWFRRSKAACPTSTRRS
jgi:glycine cleavage system H lipoate-binding protein